MGPDTVDSFILARALSHHKLDLMLYRPPDDPSWCRWYKRLSRKSRTANECQYLLTDAIALRQARDPLTYKTCGCFYEYLIFTPEHHLISKSSQDLLLKGFHQRVVLGGLIMIGRKHTSRSHVRSLFGGLLSADLSSAVENNTESGCGVCMRAHRRVEVVSLRVSSAQPCAVKSVRQSTHAYPCSP